MNLPKATKRKINSTDDTTRPNLLAEYSELNKRVKMYARRDKRAWADKLAHKAQLAAEINNSRELYQMQGSLLHATKQTLEMQLEDRSQPRGTS